MEQLAPDVYLLGSFPRHSINAYLIGGILVDSGVRFMRRGLMRQLRGKKLELHVLTHAHPDHQGSSRAICPTTPNRQRRAAARPARGARFGLRVHEHMRNLSEAARAAVPVAR